MAKPSLTWPIIGIGSDVPAYQLNQDLTDILAGLSSTTSGWDISVLSATLGTPLVLKSGGTGADLSGTGGASNYLKQSSAGAVVTVGTIPASDIQSGAALSVANDTNVTLTASGTPLTALLVAATVTAGWTGTLAAGRLNSSVVQGITNDTNVTGSIAAQVLTLGFTGNLAGTRGGTGTGTNAVGDLLQGDTSNTWSRLASVAAGSWLKSAGVTTKSVWSTTTLVDSWTQGDLVTATSGTALGRLAAVAAGSFLRSAGTGTVPAYSTLTLPNTMAINTILFASSANVGDVIAAPGTNVVLTGNSGAPSWQTNITIGTLTSGAITSSGVITANGTAAHTFKGPVQINGVFAVDPGANYVGFDNFGGLSRWFSWGADNATRGTFSMLAKSSAGALSTTVWTMDGAGNSTQPGTLTVSGTGTSSLAGQLNVSSASGTTTIKIIPTGAALGQITFRNFADNAYATAQYIAGQNVFLSGATEGMRVWSSTGVSIANSPSDPGAQNLSVAGTLNIGSVPVAISVGMDWAVATGAVTAVSSSQRYKSNIQNYNPPSALVLSLQPRSFTWNEKTMNCGQQDVGLIAEEVAAIIPNLAIPDGKGGYHGVRYNMLAVYLLSIIKRHEARIKALELAANISPLAMIEHPVVATVGITQSGEDALAAAQKAA